MSTAVLGFQIDSSEAANAASDLDKLTSSATKAEQAAAKVSGAGSRMSRGFADLNPALEKIIGSLGRLEATTSSIDKRLDAMSSAATRAAKANTVLDQSAVEASSAYKMLETSLNAVTAAQKKTDAAQAGSLAMIEKQKAAIASLNAELAKLRNTPMPSQPNNQRPANQNGGQGSVGNIAAQLFDIGSTAAFMSPATVGLQQGPQLAQAFAGQSAKQALTGLAAGFTAILSPVSLAAIGLTAAAAAAIQFGSAAFESIGKASDALEKHDEIIRRIKDRYDAASESGAQFGRQTQSEITFLANRDQAGLNKQLASNLRGFQADAGLSFMVAPQAEGLGLPEVDAGQVARFGTFSDQVKQFVSDLQSGRGDVLEFNRSIQEIASVDPEDKALQRIADRVLALTEDATAAAQEIEDLNQRRRELEIKFSRTNSAANAQKYNDANVEQAFFLPRRFNADLMGIGARSPAQLAAAERARLEAEPVDAAKESAENRSTRINQQVELTRRRAQQQLDDAQRDRAMNLDKTLADQQNEIDLIGKTGGAAASLRKEYELTSQLRMEAARNGTEVDQKELALIHDKTAAYAPLCNPYDQTAFAAGFNIESEE